MMGRSRVIVCSLLATGCLVLAGLTYVSRRADLRDALADSGQGLSTGRGGQLVVMPIVLPNSLHSESSL